MPGHRTRSPGHHLPSPGHDVLACGDHVLSRGGPPGPARLPSAPMHPATPIEPGRPARALLERHRAAAGLARSVLDHLDAATLRIATIVESDRDDRVRAELGVVPVVQLGAMTDRNLRLRALQDAGYPTAADLLGVSADTLDRIPGVGAQTARSVVAAVEQVAAVVRRGLPVRLEIDRSGRPDTATTIEVLRLLDRLMRLTPLVEPHRRALTEYVTAVGVHAPAAEPATGRLRFALSRPATRRRTRDALAELGEWDAVLGTDDDPRSLASTLRRLSEACAVPDTGSSQLWDAFERRAAEFYTVLGRIVPLAQDVLAERGMLTTELAETVAAFPLDQSALRVSLRGYQEFGARFALTQGRVLLGDEMGLGKTVQALAAIAHLAALGDRHFLVVCPAGVLVNWLREIQARTTLPAHRLHGPDRAGATARWRTEGGVAVTTYEALAHLELDGPPVALLVVDEAHYVKNPDAQRSAVVAEWTRAVWRVLFLTGTPMDNRIEDFVALVRLLDPGLADSFPRHLGLVGADAFRRTVSSVYLRRNQKDVLVELPDLVLVDDWVDLSPADERVYREAVASGNFMAMRRAAWTVGTAEESAKLDRLRSIVEEAGEQARRTVVFSYFRDVLDLAADALTRPGGAPVFGPLTGSMPADRRQEVIDAFSEGPRDGVLIAQITVGGVGLNLQAASVAVLCEPQLTPTAEAQAVARLHRMGQVHAVVAHRLLAEDGVDERITELLARKQRTFDAYVRDSALAASAAAAVDVTEARLAREVVELEQARLGYGPVWEQLAEEADG